MNNQVEDFQEENLEETNLLIGENSVLAISSIPESEIKCVFPEQSNSN